MNRDIKHLRGFSWIIGFFLALLFFGGGVVHVQADSSGHDSPPGPDRFRQVEESYTRYEWWLTAWENNQVDCVLEVTHPGLPYGYEIFEQCGADLYNVWARTQPCREANASACAGEYLYLADSQDLQHLVAKPLPEARLWVTAPGCLAQDWHVWCPDEPNLTLAGDEPLDGYYVSYIEGYLDDTYFLCRDDSCELTFPTETDAIFDVRAWGFSTYGDSTREMDFRVRVLPTDDGWHLYVSSAVWQGVPQPPCGYLWQSFPDEDLPAWLQPVQDAADLHTEKRYVYLSGQVLSHHFADAAACADGGLLSDEWASECGVSAAWHVTSVWQNRFDEQILDASRQYQISPRLLKNVFAVESQFWPGTLVKDHAGLGQMTADGADLTLMWSPVLFEQFCPAVFCSDTCEQGYQGLSNDERAFLRQALMAAVNADCPDCPGGVDFDKAADSIYVFADTMRASCAQTGRLITNLTGAAPGEILNYADLWRLTLADYHSGSGCVSDALRSALKQNTDLSWEVLQTHFPAGCQDAIPYVNAVTTH